MKTVLTPETTSISRAQRDSNLCGCVWLDEDGVLSESLSSGEVLVFFRGHGKLLESILRGLLVGDGQDDSGGPSI